MVDGEDVAGRAPIGKKCLPTCNTGVAAGGAERLEAVRRAGWSSAAALGANGFQGRRERGRVGGDVGMRGFRNFGVGGAEFFVLPGAAPVPILGTPGGPKTGSPGVPKMGTPIVSFGKLY